MANPVLPAEFNLGSYLGEQIGSGLHGGLSKSIGEAYESKLLEKALRDLDPNSSAADKWQKFMSLPISNQSKQLGLKYLKDMQGKQPTLESVQKGLQGRSKQVESLDSLVKSADFETLQALEQEALKRGGDAKAIDSVLSDWMGNKEWRPGTPLTKGSPSLAEKPTPKKGFAESVNKNSDKTWGTVQFEKFLRTNPVGKILGLNDPERLMELEHLDPEAFNDVISNTAGQVIGWLPLFRAMRVLGLGNVAAMAATGGLAEGADQTWSLARKNAKGEEITAADYEKAAGHTLKEAAKGATWAKVTQWAPIQKLISALPGGQSLLKNAYARGAAQLAEGGLVGPESASVLVEGKPQSSEDRLKNLFIALGFKGLEAAGAQPQGGGPRGPAGPVRQEPAQIGFNGPGQITNQPRMDGGGPPQPLQQMVQGAKSGEQAMQSLRTAQKSRGLGPQGFQQAQGAAVQPGSEAVGDVSRTLAPQPQEQGPLRTPGSEPARAPSRVSGGNLPQNNAALQDANVVSGLANRITPPAQTGAPVPRPQPQQELEPLQREQRMGMMRGEKPFLGEERAPTGREKTETLQKRSDQEKMVQFHTRQLKELVKELNLRQAAARGATGAEKAAIESEIESYKAEIDQVKKRLRAANKELEGRKSLTDQNIERAIATRRGRLLDEATNPPKTTEKDIGKRQLKNLAVQQKIKEAKALARKKDNLPEDYNDSFLRVKQRYVDEFTKLRDHAEKEMKNSSPGSNEHKVAKRLYEEADAIVKEAEADIIRHRHKKGAEHAEKETKGKEDLKKREETSKKIGKVTPQRLNEFNKSVKQYLDSKSPASLKRVAESMGVEPAEVQSLEREAVSMGRDFASRAFRPLNIKPKAQEQESSKEKTQEKASGTEDLHRKKGESQEDFRERMKEKTKGKEKFKEEPKKEETAQEKKAREKKEKEDKAAQEEKDKPFLSRFFPKTGQFKQQAKALWESLQKGQFKEAALNPLAKAFIYQSAFQAIQHALLPALGIERKFPLGSAAYAVLGRNPFQQFFAALFTLGKAAYEEGRERHYISEYNKALKDRNLPRVRELESEMGPKIKKKAKDKRSQ